MYESLAELTWGWVARLKATGSSEDTVSDAGNWTHGTNVKGGEILSHGVSTLSDYVRLSVKRKCPLGGLPC